MTTEPATTDRTATRLGWACLAVALLTYGPLSLGLLADLDRIGWLPVNVAWGAVLAGAAVTVVLGSLREIVARRGSNPRLGAWPAGAGMTLVVLGPCFGMFAFPVCTMLDIAGTHALNRNRLQQLAAAVHLHQDRHGTLPSPAILSPDGRPLLSWRVAILPYLDQQSLYDRFRLNEPWDSPHNAALVSAMPDVYRWARDPYTPAGHTYFQAVVGPGTAFERAGLRIPEDFPDGPSNTILLVEAATAVPWTQPADVAYDPNGPLPTFGANIPWRGHRRDRPSCLSALADGSVRRLQKNISPATLRAALTRNGGDKLGSDW